MSLPTSVSNRTRSRFRLAALYSSSIILGMACTAGLSLAATVKNGDTIEMLETQSGRKYEQVTVREILPDGLKIIHSSGTATVPAADLPQYASVFAAVAPATPPGRPLPESSASSKIAEPAWLPTSVREVTDCSLFVNVSKGLTMQGDTGSWSGTAFLCNHGQTTYIYSNAHNFSGAVEFAITDKSGRKYDDFVSVEIAGEGGGHWKAKELGGDIVRIRLREFRPKALSLDMTPLTSKAATDRKIVVTGNTGGRGTITDLRGAITGMEDSFIIMHNAQTEPGNSGSPIVDFETYKVVGILTWGRKLPDAVQSLWSKKPDEVREGFKSGAALATVRYEPTTFEKLKSQRQVMLQLMKNVRLFGLLDTLIPAKQGLFVNRQAVVMGDYTVEDLLAESSSHPVVKELVALDAFLRSKASGNIGINNQDMLKRYIETYQRCLNMISSQRKAMENTDAATFYMKCELRSSRLIAVCKAYEALSSRTLAWYVQQRGTGGQSLPLEQRFRLPAMRSGLNGLGLKE